MALSQWSNYDYNGVIFVFGRMDSTLTSNWSSITKVAMSVDSSSNFLYEATIKEIPYSQYDNDNNVACKVFNINTFQHRLNTASKYQYSSGTHTCYLRFYNGSSLVASTNVSVEVHATLSTPTATLDSDTGVLTLSRSSTSGSPRYYIEIRRSDRTKVNNEYTYEEKDYIHTVVMKGIEGGKYNEGIPHTALMTRGEVDISGSSRAVRQNTNEEAVINLMSLESEPMLMSVDSSSPTTVQSGVAINYTYSGSTYTYYKFTAPTSTTYSFVSDRGESGADLMCTVYSDAAYSTEIASDDDSGGNFDFSCSVALSAGQTVYIKLYDYSRNASKTATWYINTVQNISFSPFTSYEIPPKGMVQLSYYSSSQAYITIYAENRNPNITISSATSGWYTVSSGKTPYSVARLSEATTNTIIIGNKSDAAVKFYHTNVHSDVDYQPYWRINPIDSYKVGVVFDNAEIMAEYEDLCMAQVDDAMTRLNAILSESAGISVVSTPVNLGVSKAYVSETVTPTTIASRYINSSNKITSSSGKTLYYAAVTAGSIYRVSYNHADLFLGTSYSTGTTLTKISASSSNIWYEDVGFGVGVDTNTLVVYDKAIGYYVFSNESFTLEKVTSWFDSMDEYENAFNDYDVLVRFGLDGTTWLGNQGIATSGELREGGTSAEINGQGKWGNYIYYSSKSGVSWSYATINIDTSDLFESLYHVIHEEIAQSLGIGDDCYSHEESIHWDPEYANPDYYVGIDRKILDFAYKKDKNGYTQFDLCNEFDLPITLFREYSEYNSTAKGFQFHLKDAGGNWLLRAGTYEIYAWCVRQGTNGSGGVSGSGSDGWDDDPYSVRSVPVTFTVEGGWYWDDYGIDMKKGLKVTDVPYTVWNEFVDAVIEVMGTGTIPSDSTNYGTAAGMSFAEGILKAKASEDNKTLYAQRFNIVNYIISNSGIDTGIGVQTSLLSQVFAEYMIKLQDCRNLL